MSQAFSRLYRFGEFTVDSDQKVLLRDGAPLALPPKIFDTLLILVDNGGRLVGKDELMHRLWPDTFVEEGNLTFNIQQLRKSLGDDARHPRFIETVPRRGYRFIAPIEEIPSDGEIIAASPLGPKDPNVEHTAAGRSRKTETLRKGLLAAIAVVAVAGVVIGAWLLWLRGSARPQPSTDRLMLAVLPFQNLTGDASQDYFSDGLTEEMITQLGSLDPQHLGVIARSSVMHFKNSQEPLDQIGRELGVQYVLEGSVRRESDKVRITAQLIQLKDQTHLWSREYDREVSHLLVLQEEIAQDVAGEIRLTLGDKHQPAATARQASLSPQTYEAYDL